MDTCSNVLSPQGEAERLKAPSRDRWHLRWGLRRGITREVEVETGTWVAVFPPGAIWGGRVENTFSAQSLRVKAESRRHVRMSLEVRSPVWLETPSRRGDTERGGVGVRGGRVASGGACTCSASCRGPWGSGSQDHTFALPGELPTGMMARFRPQTLRIDQAGWAPSAGHAFSIPLLVVICRVGCGPRHKGRLERGSGHVAWTGLDVAEVGGGLPRAWRAERSAEVGSTAQVPSRGLPTAWAWGTRRQSRVQEKCWQHVCPGRCYSPAGTGHSGAKCMLTPAL